MVAELIEKYVWLVQTFITAGTTGLTLEELAAKWERRFSVPYPRRTFNNHREAVAEVFGIWIECRRSDNKYYIEGGRELLDKDASVGWMISTFTVGSLLSLGRERLQGRVALENIPSGQIYLTPVISAMTEQKIVLITYRKYGNSETEALHVHPYAVKEFQSRWYLLGMCEERNALRLYGLDRIHSLEITDGKFKMPADFDVKGIFYNSFGPYLTSQDSVPVKILFRAKGKDVSYFKDLPLHHTQEIEKEEPDSAVFSINLVPNDNFYMELCRYGARIEILSPESVRERTAYEHSQALKIYQ